MGECGRALLPLGAVLLSTAVDYKRKMASNNRNLSGQRNFYKITIAKVVHSLLKIEES